ncbi:MAG: DUF3737 family protein [Clostridiales bacterium]|nr:DUF3737 family protein [Clostridiales bacterium]
MRLESQTITERLALYGEKELEIVNCKIEGDGVRAIRECKNIIVKDCEIATDEFGWNADGVRITDSSAKSEYFMLRAENVAARRLDIKGKYAFQYAEGAIIMDSKIDTTEGLWKAKGVTLENCVIIGEYLGWYSENLTLKNCTIIGTRPLCYCKKVRLIDCVMQKTDGCFEQSEVYATLRAPLDSVKNPLKGVIKVPEVGEIVRDDKKAKCKILFDEMLDRAKVRENA